MKLDLDNADNLAFCLIGIECNYGCMVDGCHTPLTNQENAKI